MPMATVELDEIVPLVGDTLNQVPFEGLLTVPPALKLIPAVLLPRFRFCAVGTVPPIW